MEPGVFGISDAGHDRVPLLAVKIAGVVCDFTAQITLQQHYVNDSDLPLEISYTFPGEELGAITSFSVLLGDKKIKGILKDSQRAGNEYDDAIASGNGAYLFEQTAEGTSTCRIGNLPPGSFCTIEITYVTELAAEDGQIRFLLPSFLTPFHLNPSSLKHPTQGLSATLTFNMASDIKDITSSHQFVKTINGRKADFILVNDSLVRSLSVLVSVVDPFQARLWVEPMFSEEGRLAGYASMAVFHPHVQSFPRAEFIFIIDRSGSMQGTPIHDARAALQILLRSIPEGSKFNIIGFGTQFECMKPTSVLYDEESFQMASQHVEKTSADLGGTDLLKPLKYLFSQPVDPNHPRQVFVLTDGCVENETEVFKTISNAAETTNTRIFSLGIGDGVSHKLVDGLARHARGTSLFVKQNEKMESKVVGQLKLSLQPAVTGQINWSVPVEQTPEVIPPIFGNAKLIVYSMSIEQPTKVTLLAQTSDKTSFGVELIANLLEGTSFVRKLSARSRIRDLEDGDQIAAVSLRHQVLSEFTSFVAVEERSGATIGTMQTKAFGSYIEAPVLCPPEVTIDAAQLAQYEAELQAASCHPLPDEDDEFDSFSATGLGSGSPYVETSYATDFCDDDDLLVEVEAKKEKKENQKPTLHDRLQAVMVLQKFNGTWALDSAFAKAIELELDKLISNKPDKIDDVIWATALGISFLEVRLTDLKEAWEMSIQKSTAYLKRNGNESVIILAMKCFS